MSCEEADRRSEGKASVAAFRSREASLATRSNSASSTRASCFHRHKKTSWAIVSWQTLPIQRRTAARECMRLFMQSLLYGCIFLLERSADSC